MACADSTNPRHYAAWTINGALADAQLGYFALLDLGVEHLRRMAGS